MTFACCGVVRFTVLLPFFLFAACSPASTTAPTATGPRLLVTTVSSSTARLTLQNQTPETTGYNLCASALQRLAGPAWIDVPTGDVCTMELRTLGAGESATLEKALPAGLARGEYRFVTSVETPLGAKQTGVASDPFMAGER